ncbi:hypothetical protein PMAYCL1PPCAC_28626 [Pristionchus mayeri]|uniref:PB1 domain-containing protein n=1 Tax=Pristionchus mayeri TaxID=1317129 RepID=A0AAN5D7U1_9BILA|nr:hypothetical protein PMAYCL1PPCAC_28626 [Pristionchus mayeri]
MTQSEEKMHFKLWHNGRYKRFTVSPDCDGVLSSIRKKVSKICGTEEFSLNWMDEDAPIALEDEDDLETAIDFSKRTKKHGSCPCVLLSIVEKNEEDTTESTGSSQQDEEEEESAEGTIYNSMDNSRDFRFTMKHVKFCREAEHVD